MASPLFVLWSKQYQRIQQMGPKALHAPPANPLRRAAFKVVEHPVFDGLVFFIIFVNVVGLTLNNASSNVWVNRVVNSANDVVALCFMGEALLKLVAYGGRYLRSKRHMFDFTVMAVGALDLSLDFFFKCGGSHNVIISVVRAMRVVRILKLLRFVAGFRVILRAVVYPTRAFVTVVLLMMVVVLLAANVSMSLFGHVAVPSPVNMFANFSKIRSAVELFSIFATGDLWNQLLASFVDAPTDTLNFVYARVYQVVAVSFIIVFEVVVYCLLFNLFVLVIVEAFDIVLGERYGLPEALITEFQKAWRDFDPEATGFITKAQVRRGGFNPV
jgi:hypothetical protein